MTHEQAELIGIMALAWLAAHDELGPTFLGSTGASPEDLRNQAADPAFLTSVLEFVTMDDTWVIAFCTAEGLAFDRPLMARQVLSGAADMHWT